MAPRRSAAGGVKGPNSALTEFLRSQGINAAEIQQRAIEREAAALRDSFEEETEQLEEEIVDSVAADSLLEVYPESSSKKNKKNKKRPLGCSDDDGEDENGPSLTGKHFRGGFAKAPRAKPDAGAIEKCAECGSKFTITVYSREDPNGSGGYLCYKCGAKYLAQEKKKKATPKAVRKKRRTQAKALLDKKESLIPKLQDICVKIIAKHIDDVDELGDLSLRNMLKVSHIVCKNRALTPHTVKLFLQPHIRHLELWDCSALDANSLESIAAFCPYLEELTLNMCGRITDSVIRYYASQLKNLKKFTCLGPFLVTNTAWCDFFKQIGKNLKSFHISDTHRYDPSALEAMVENCTELTDVSISRCDTLTKNSLNLLVFLDNLKEIEISNHADQSLVEDEFVVDLINKVGHQLTKLNLDGCTSITDAVLVSIREHCSNLRKISFESCQELTDDGCSFLFLDLKTNEGFTDINFTRCDKICDEGVSALIKHSGHTLKSLRLNSLHSLTIDGSLNLIGKQCSSLEYLDLGFVRSVDDKFVIYISKACKKLRLFEIYGDNSVTKYVNLRKGISLVGRERDYL